MSDTTSTCYCGAVQLFYSIKGDNLLDSVSASTTHQHHSES